MFGKVGGTEPVNQLIKTYGLNTIRATGTAEAWFKARDAYPNRTICPHLEETSDLGLTNEQEDQLVAFLKTLTDGYTAHKTITAASLAVIWFFGKFA